MRLSVRLNGLKSARSNDKSYRGSHCFQISRPVLIIESQFSTQKRKIYCSGGYGSLQKWSTLSLACPQAFALFEFSLC